MPLPMTSLIEFAAAFAIVAFILRWLNQDQHHDDGSPRPVRVPVIYRKSRRGRR